MNARFPLALILLVVAGCGKGSSAQPAKAPEKSAQPAPADLSKVADGAAIDQAAFDAFRADLAGKAAATAKNEAMGLPTRHQMTFFGPELRHLSVGKFWGEEAVKVSRASKPENADPLPCIVDFKDQLDKLGVELLLVPVPAKAVIYPELVSEVIKPDAGRTVRVDLAHQAFYAELRRQGVQVLDLVPAFLAAKRDVKTPGDLFCRQDTHWSGIGCEVAGREIAAWVRARPWSKDLAAQKLASVTRATEITGDLFKALDNPLTPKESLLLRYVGTPGNPGTPGNHAIQEVTPLEDDKASPVILMGDSHNLVFHIGGDMHAKGAGLADQLALELGIALDVIGVRGSGATPARINLLRRARAHDTYLKQKKLVIWCFTVREFTESTGWTKLPILKPQ